MSPSLKAAIFDFDGLLADTEGIFDHIIQLYARHMTGAAIPEPAFSQLRRAMFGRKKEESEALLYAQLNLDPSRISAADQYLVWRQPKLEVLFQTTRLLPGAKEVVTALHEAGHLLAIATSSTRDDLDIKCSSHPWLLGKFSAVITGDQVAKGKPDPELFLQAASALNLPLSECLVLEDAANGVEAALNGQAGRIIAVPDQRADQKVFQALKNQAREGRVSILNSLVEFDPDHYTTN